MDSPNPKPIEKYNKKRRDQTGSKVGQSVDDIKAKKADRIINTMQRNFATYWARGETVSNAAIRAGYADGIVGYKLRHDPAVLRVYNVEKALFEDDNKMSRQKVLDGLIDGIETAKLLGEPASIINGWKTIGQMCGYFEPVKKTIDININGTVQMKRLEAMSDVELMKLITEDVQEVVFREILEAEDDDAAKDL